MAYELVYTSAPEGLARGSSGFCVVACTKGLGPRLVVTLEGLSAYKPLYPHYAPNAWDNPVSRSHYVCSANGEQQHILSRICFNGVDHTQRSNKLASHLVLSERETAIAQGGPSSLLLCEELFKDASWPIKAEYFPVQKQIPATSVQVQKCSLWETIAGDAGWAGFLAQTYLDFPGKNVYIAYSPEQNKYILPLFHEAMSLLPDEVRWQVTFNTYFVNLPAGMSCSWRACPADSDAMRAARHSPANVVIDLTKPQPLTAEGELITVARTGIIAKAEEPIPIEPEELTPDETEEMASGPGTAESSELGLQRKKLLPPPLRKAPFGMETIQLPQTGIIQNPPNLPPDSDNEYEEEEPSFFERWKAVIIIAAAICLLVAVSGGIFYCVSLKKEQQTYVEQNGKYKQLLESYEGVKSRREECKKRRAEERKDIENLIFDMKELLQAAKYIRDRARKLLQYQPLFEQRLRKDIGEDDGDTPKGLIEKCDSLVQDLKAALDSLDKKLKKAKAKEADERARREREERAARGTSAGGTGTGGKPAGGTSAGGTGTEGKPAGGTSAGGTGTEGKPAGGTDTKGKPAGGTSAGGTGTEGKPAGGTGTGGKPAPAPAPTSAAKPEKEEDPGYYAWIDRDPHKMTKGAKISIKLQCTDPTKISIYLAPKTKSIKIGDKLSTKRNDNYRVVEIETKFDESKGILSFTQTSQFTLHEDVNILIVCDGKEIPLYFRLGTSRIRIKAPKKENLKIEIKNGIKIALKADAIRMPDQFYRKDDKPCDAFLYLGAYRLQKKGTLYVYEGNDPEGQGLFRRQQDLRMIEEEIKRDPVRFVPSDKLNDIDHASYTTISKPDTLDKIRALCNQSSPQASVAVDSSDAVSAEFADMRMWLKKRHPDGKTEDKDINEWIVAFDKLQNELVKKLGEFQLKDLGYGNYPETLPAAKKKMEADLQAYRKKIRNKILSATVSLVYSDKEYEQFSVQELLQ